MNWVTRSEKRRKNCLVAHPNKYQTTMAYIIMNPTSASSDLMSMLPDVLICVTSASTMREKSTATMVPHTAMTLPRVSLSPNLVTMG